MVVGRWWETAGLRMWRNHLGALVLTAALSGCGIADDLSGHSVEYNEQAAAVKKPDPY